jgi:hypothetical protein
VGIPNRVPPKALAVAQRKEAKEKGTTVENPFPR